LAAVAAIQPLVFLNLPLGRILWLSRDGLVRAAANHLRRFMILEIPARDVYGAPRFMAVARSWHLGLEPEAVFVKRHQRARSRSDPVQAPLNAFGRVIPFTAPGAVLSVVGGLYEWVAIRHVDCVSAKAAR
jgi:hypothetical protein